MTLNLDGFWYILVPLISCRTLDKLHNFSELQFHYLWNGVNGIYLMGYCEDITWSNTWHVTGAITQLTGVPSQQLSHLCFYTRGLTWSWAKPHWGTDCRVLQESACGTEENQTYKLILATSLESEKVSFGPSPSWTRVWGLWRRRGLQWGNMGRPALSKPLQMIRTQATLQHQSEREAVPTGMKAGCGPPWALAHPWRRRCCPAEGG